MKKNEFSELGSNMLIVGSVTLALETTCTGLYRRKPVHRLRRFFCNLRNLWIVDLFDQIAFRVVHRYIAERCDLVLNLLPISNNHNRRAIGVEVFRCHALNVCRS